VERRGALPHDQRDEHLLLHRARTGDHRAYAALVQPHQELALRLSYLITRDVHEAEDAVQEALVKTYFSLRRFHAGRPFRPWLLRIVINEAKDRQRASSRRRRLLAQLDEQPEPVSQTAEAAFVDRARLEEVLAAIESLREEERLVIACRALLGLSEEETAAALALPLGTTKSRYARARASLRQTIGDDDE
jgi:RNA polymerase sigma-70 factor (ECF subfamily)